MSHAASTLSILRSQSLSSAVALEIERMILSGELPPGARVNEHDMARRFDVSRGPVREACRGLARFGLVQVEPRRGVFVREVDVTEVLENYDIRAGLARAAGRRGAERAGSDDRARIETLMAEMDAAAADGNVETFHDRNLAFHDTLFAIADSRQLREMHRGLVQERQLFRRRRMVTEGGLATSQAEHRPISWALRAGEAGACAAAFEDHVLRSKARFEASLAGAPETAVSEAGR